MWQLNLVVLSGPYTVRIAAITDLTFKYTLYKLDPSSNYGFTTVEGNPQEGKLYVELIYQVYFIQTSARLASSHISLYLYSSAYGFVVEL